MILFIYMKKYFIILLFLSIYIINIELIFARTYLPNTNFSYSAWIPYWARWQGVDELYATADNSGNMIYNSNFSSTSSNAGIFLNNDIKNKIINIDKLDIISPFTFEVDNTGAFQDKGKMNEDAFASLIEIAHTKGKKVYPTVLWANGEEINKVLKDRSLQDAIYADVMYNVMKYNLDGIDIDFEGKKSETREDFSYLLKTLSIALHNKNKGLICTIEPRIPLESIYETINTGTIENIERANDYRILGEYCDQIRIMAYDQMGADIVLNNKNKDKLYRPVADINWVESIIKNTIEEGLPAKKIVLGVATYGYKFEISSTTPILTNTNTPDKYGSVLLNNLSQYKYSRIGSMNYFYADELAKNLGIIPTRNNGGELEFSYSTSSDLSNTFSGIIKNYYVEYSDSKAIEQKIDLAKKYSLAGIAIFKIDGNNDHNIWNVLIKDSSIVTNPNTECYLFNKNMNIGSNGNDVLMLQKLLNQNGFTLAASGAGSAGNETSMYGRATFNAIKKLQEKYKDKILTPSGLRKGTGYFGESTRKYINDNFCVK